jgi:hypothetical protein
MRKSLCLLLLASGLAAQDRVETLLSKLAESPRLARIEGAVEQRRDLSGVTYRVAPNQYRAVFGPGLTWRNERDEIQLNEPQLWQTDRGWTLTGGPVRTRITRGVDGDVVEFWRVLDGQWVNSLTMRPGKLEHESDFRFRLSAYGLDWTFEVTGQGFDLRSAPIPKSLGERTYAWQISGPLQPDEAGNLTGEGGTLITRAVMLGANGKRHPCSGWSPSAEGFAFACDDSDLPPEAFPYVIDPTGTYYAGDFISAYGNGGPWVPSYVGTAGQAEVTAGYEYSYVWALLAFKFDTSPIPDNATITAAQLYLYLNSITNPESRTLAIEWYNPNNWSGPQVYQQTPVSGNILSSWTPSVGWNGVGLDSSNISKTGYTAIRISASSTSPTPTQLNSWTFGAPGWSNPPYIEVTYTLPPSAVQIIVVTSGPAR